ncbi:MAG: helix-turn-helix transcriptional regulator [Coprothermobacterota bacterium]|nr:helix-turn-helix transcriptional regulator [Coprothermobacterota bacterium]
MKKGKSLKDLAEELEISYQNLFAILSGKTRLTLSMAKKIAGYLRLSVDELAEAEEKGFRQDKEKGNQQDREIDVPQKGEKDIAQEGFVVRQDREMDIDQDLMIRSWQGTDEHEERRELDAATEAPLQSMSQRRQHAQLRSSELLHQPSVAQSSLFQLLSEREADQLLFQFLELIERGRVPRYFFRILAERLKPYLAEQTKYKPPREE